MTLRMGLLIVFAITMLLAIACGKGEEPTSSPTLDAIHVQLIESSPKEVKLSREYEARLTSADGVTAIDVEAVELLLSTSMRDGMTHQKNGEMIRQGDGVYRIKIELPMEGSWKASVRLKENGHERTVSEFGRTANS